MPFILSLLILLVISLIGWVIKLHQRIDKIEIQIGIKGIPEKKLSEVSFIYTWNNCYEYKIRAKVISEIGNQYLVQFIESYPKFRSDTHNPFTNNRILIPKKNILK